MEKEKFEKPVASEIASCFVNPGIAGAWISLCTGSAVISLGCSFVAAGL